MLMFPMSIHFIHPFTDLFGIKNFGRDKICKLLRLWSGKTPHAPDPKGTPNWPFRPSPKK